MKLEIIASEHLSRAGVVAVALVLGMAAGCRNSQPVRTDQQIATDVQAKIQTESALHGQNIQVTVANGVATLSGSVTDEASRALAGNDSGSISGVKTVVNNLTVQPAQQSVASAAPPAPEPFQAAPPPRAVLEKHSQDKHSRNEHQREDQPAPVSSSEQEVAQASPASPAEPPPPPRAPRPSVRQVALPEGTIVPVRVTETLDSKTAQPNQSFHGSLASDIGVQGVIAIPRGSAVTGRIVNVQEAAHFKGNALLSLELTQLTAQGRNLTLVTDTYSKQGAGRGKNTAAKAGGGAALGAIIGAIAGGGKGAAIGGLAGGGAGVGVNAATRGEQAVIPTETIVNFTLRSPITVTVTIPPQGGGDNGDAPDPQLQPR
jgi:hypothetical protein